MELFKSKFYASQPRSLDNSRQRLFDECPQITPEAFKNVLEMYFCMEVKCQNFRPPKILNRIKLATEISFE